MTDEMYTTRQAALYLGVTEADIRLAIREGKLRAWNLPAGRGLLVRKADLMRFRDKVGRSVLARQLPLFTADNRTVPAHTETGARSDTTAA
jgi:excisionase family DNA binding protein